MKIIHFNLFKSWSPYPINCIREHTILNLLKMDATTIQITTYRLSIMTDAI